MSEVVCEGKLVHACSCEWVKGELLTYKVLFPCVASWITAMAETIIEINCEMKERKEMNSGDEILESTFYFVCCCLSQSFASSLHVQALQN